MPSGSHRGSRGGHSFGGSRSGRSSGFKFTSNKRNNTYYQRNRYPIYGRSYYGRPTRYYSNSKIGSLISFLVFALIVCGALFFIQQSQVNQIKNDQLYYFNMIETAEPNQYITAEVTNQFLGEGGKYYITYKLNVTGYDLWYEDGYTYSIYTAEEASRIFRSGEILIVVDRLPLTSRTDSINADYMDFELSDDGSYIEASRLRNIAFIVGGILIFALVGSLVYYFKNMELNQTYESDYQSKSTQQINNQELKPDYCLYCGSFMSKNDKKCPQCGSARSYSK
jgi:hypothetical protein